MLPSDYVAASAITAIGGYLKDLKTHLNNGDPIMEQI